VLSEADRKRVGRQKVERFISRDKCRRIFLDQEIDGRIDRIRYKNGEERCDICRGSDKIIKALEE
jgi:hypothetical protein